MRIAGLMLAAAGAFVSHATGQTPTVGGLLNNYSYTLPGLPNYGIAQGSIFDIFGTNLSSKNQGFGPPLQSTQQGITINVTVNGTTTHPLIYFISSGQINAVLPSATPAGTGTISVTTSAGTSADFPIQVVASAFGLLTTNSGTGPAQGYDASINSSNPYILFGYSEAVNPNDVLELWGTGLGPVEGDGTFVDLTPHAQVFFGGVAATVIYAGRSGYTGLDQINVRVPAGVTGCNVSVWVVTANNYVSNFATVPVAATGRTCSDTNNLFSSALLTQIAQKGSASIGIVGLNKTTTPGTTIGGVTVGGGTTDSGFAEFLKFTYAQFNAGAYASASGGASIGSCIVNFYNANSSTVTPPALYTFTYLNAGPNVNITGPNGEISMPLKTQTFNGVTYDLYATPSSNTSFIAPGSYAFDNASGGQDVGAFTVSLNLSSPLVWSNMNSISTVTRANGQTVTWTGGDPSSTVSITGTSFGSINGSQTDFVVGAFTCQAPASAGTFTIPSAVLLSMPPSISFLGISSSTMSLSNVSNPVSFNATGLDIGWASAIVENIIDVAYQ